IVYIRFGLMPITAAESRLWLTASRAWPSEVRAKNQANPERMTTAITAAINRSYGRNSGPGINAPRRNGGGGLLDGTEEDETEICEQDRQTERDDDSVLVLALDLVAVHRREHETLEHDAEEEERHHRDDDTCDRRHAEQADRVVGRVTAQHVERAVAEIDDLEHP